MSQDDLWPFAGKPHTTITNKPVEKEIDEILKREQEFVQQCTLANIQAARETGQWIIHDPNRAATLTQLLNIITKAEQQAYERGEVETAKAFGGCKNCYGKGYSTARVGTSSRYGNVTHDRIIYCKCERGKQLATQVNGIEVAGRIDELNLMHMTTAERRHGSYSKLFACLTLDEVEDRLLLLEEKSNGTT